MTGRQESGRHRAIGDYALIGDCCSAALVSDRGSVDWLCWPLFDSPSIFAALLDDERGGKCAILPVADFTSERHYLDGTNVLETTFRTSTGVIQLVDLMSVASEAQKKTSLRPSHELLRRIVCTQGTVKLRVLCEPRPGYGRGVPRLRDRGPLGIYCESGAHLIVIGSDIPLLVEGDGSRASATLTLHAGERRYLSVALADAAPAILPPLGESAERRIDESVHWWRSWSSKCRYDGPYRSAVMRSALALKLMTFAPSGAVVAAPTTSLPEAIGGSRNWDYRYCWLRDASLTLGVLFDLGYEDEAQSYLSWLLHTTRITSPELRVLYDVYGRTDMREQNIDHLRGFADSRPVRIGNAAAGQLQLDVYGEVLDAVYQFVCRGGRLDRSTARMSIGFGMTVCRDWRLPDNGIWEIRAERQHHTFSKAMCWVGLDRLIKLHRGGHLRVPVERFERERDAIRESIEQHGFNEQLTSYVSVLEGKQLDASLLQLGRYGYIAPDSPRMRSTLDALLAGLGRDGLMFRYVDQDDGLTPGEGAFGICSFWAVAAMARAGDVAKAGRAFEKLLTHANDVGLFGEEIDPDSGAALGNFPQAFTHVGLIDAALALQQFSAAGNADGLTATHQEVAP